MLKRSMICFLLALLSVFFLSGCAKEAESEKTELVVFAASSLSDVLTAIAADYAETSPETELIFSFDASGKLKTQIEAGADCDLFFSAAPLQLEQLEEEGFLLADSRRDLLENRVVLAVPKGNPAGIHSYEALKRAFEEGNILFAMGNADVPVGQYTKEILRYLGLSEEALAERGLISYGSNVREVTSQILEGSVDCGVIYETDAKIFGLSFSDTASQATCGRVIYPAAILKRSQSPEEAGAFLHYLSSEEAAARFREFGFTPLQ